MNIQVEVRSLNASKNSTDFIAFKKYDVEISINETENANDHSTLQYAFVITSNPKNARFAIEGTAKLNGSPEQRDEILSKTDGSVPVILTSIYQELFPTLFIASKTLNVPCPPYRIGGSQMTESQQSSAAQDTTQSGVPAPQTETQSGGADVQPAQTETAPNSDAQQAKAETENDTPEHATSDQTSDQNQN